jgi:hypothetical protein
MRAASYPNPRLSISPTSVSIARRALSRLLRSSFKRPSANRRAVFVFDASYPTRKTSLSASNTPCMVARRARGVRDDDGRRAIGDERLEVRRDSG